MAAREGSTSWLAGRHDALHLVGGDAWKLRSWSSRLPAVKEGGGLRHPFIVGTSLRGLTQEENREHGVDQQHMFDRVAPALAAITARRLSRILGMPTRRSVPSCAKGGSGGVSWGPCARMGRVGAPAPTRRRALTAATATPSRPPLGHGPAGAYPPRAPRRLEVDPQAMAPLVRFAGLGRTAAPVRLGARLGFEGAQDKPPPRLRRRQWTVLHGGVPPGGARLSIEPPGRHVDSEGDLNGCTNGRTIQREICPLVHLVGRVCRSVNRHVPISVASFCRRSQHII